MNSATAGVDGVKQRLATGHELNHLHSHGAIGTRAPNTTLITVELLALALGRTPGKDYLIPAVREIPKARSLTPEQEAATVPSTAALPRMLPPPLPKVKLR